MKKSVVSCWLLVVSVAMATFLAWADVPRVIYDTDIGSSMCDLSALDMAVQLDELGYMKLIGVMLDRPDYCDPAKKGRFLEFTDRTLAGLGRTDIPIARSMPLKDADGNPREAGVYIPYWSIVDSNDVTTGEAVLPEVNTNRYADLPDAVALYRRLLYDSDDRTVSICAVGFFNNLIALMKSEANDRKDGIPMSGMDLIQRKVKGLWVMAGCFNNNGIAQDGHGEYNVWTDIPSAKYVFENWPGEIIFSPWEVGLRLEYKAEWMAHDYPAGGRCPAMHYFQKWWGNPPHEVDPYPNRLWDNAAVLNVIVGESAVPLSERGTVRVRDSDGSGVTEFTPDENGNCRYQVADRIDVDRTMKFMRGISTADPTRKIPRVIIDTDIGSSVDDLVALDLAASGHWSGDINLIGVMMDRPDGSDPRGKGEFLRFADAYMTTLNMDNVPIGKAFKDLSGIKVFTPYWTLIHSNDTVTGELLMRGSGRDITKFPDAVTLYRRLLNESPDNSVDICQIGFFGNLVALMDSTGEFGDGIGKSGKELIREKVRTLRVMAGCFEDNGIAQGGHGEFNVWGDIDSARRIFNEWPGKIVCSPWEVGLNLKYEPDWMRLDFPCGCANEVLHAFDEYWHAPAPTDEFPNRLWDALTVIGVVHEGLVPLSPCGEIDVEEGTGVTRFTQRMGERCRYQYLESEADAASLMETMRVILSDGRSSETWSVGENGENIEAYTNGEGVLTFIGTGEMRDFTSAADVPWDPAKVTRVEVDDGVKVIGANAFAALEEFVPVNGLPISFQKEVASATGPRNQALPEGTIAVSKTEIEAAGAATLAIVDGTAYVGVSVKTNGDLTAEQKSWGKVKFDKDVKVDVSADGTELVIPVPANAEKGFMVLESGEATK